PASPLFPYTTLFRSVVIRDKSETVLAHPMQVGATMGGGHGALRRSGGVPKRGCHTIVYVGRPYRPGVDDRVEKGIRGTAPCIPADEGDSFPVGRPPRRAVPGECRGNPLDRRLCVAEYAHQRMAAPRRHEGERGAVGRPPQGAIGPPCIKQLLSFSRAVYMAYPYLPLTDERNAVAGR